MPGQAPAAADGELCGQGANLALATWAFAINFWAWNLIGPLSATYTKAMSLTSTQTALLVATPILVGSVGRIPDGALTDRYGGRKMFTAISLITIVPVLLVTFAGHIDSYALLLVFGFFLGIGGTTFAVGIPFVNAWYEKSRRGDALARRRRRDGRGGLLATIRHPGRACRGAHPRRPGVQGRRSVVLHGVRPDARAVRGCQGGIARRLAQRV